MKYIPLIGFLGLLVYLPGCEDLPCNKSVDQSRIDAVDQVQLQADIQGIDAYLDAQGITAVKDVSGVRYVVKTQGFGGTPCLENQVSVIYKGRLLATGKEFDGGIAEFKLNELILGWQIVLPMYPKGTKLTIYVPSVFGYGSGGTATSTIPANSNLIFDIELTNIR
jgi:FKBP-type peptidyl-prolyl cis-trans isomerase FkpA